MFVEVLVTVMVVVVVVDNWMFAALQYSFLVLRCHLVDNVIRILVYGQ